jgi:hypothetical protein
MIIPYIHTVNLKQVYPLYYISSRLEFIRKTHDNVQSNFITMEMQTISEKETRLGGSVTEMDRGSSNAF